MGKWKAFVPIALALVIALSGSLFLYKWLKTQTTPKEMVKVETEAIPVVVAAVDLPWGTKLEPEMIQTIAFLKESVPSGYFSKTSSLSGRVIIAPLKKNEPVRPVCY